MLNTICLSQTNSIFFSDLIFGDPLLYTSMEVAITLLRDRWSSFLSNKSNSHLFDSKNLVHDILSSNAEEKVIKELASKIFFIKKSVYWSKVCKGHKVSISVEPERKSEVDKLIREISLFLNKNPEIISHLTKGDRIRVPKKRNLYLGEFTVVHLNNAQSCSSPSELYFEKKIVSVFNVLKYFDAFLTLHALDFEKEYKVLFDLMVS